MGSFALNSCSGFLVDGDLTVIFGVVAEEDDLNGKIVSVEGLLVHVYTFRVVRGVVDIPITSRIRARQC